jgi:hypothetical protein
MSTTQVHDLTEQEPVPDQAVVEPDRTVVGGRPGRRNRRRLLISVVALVVVAVAIVGVRIGSEDSAPRAAVVSVAHPAAPVPTNAAVEAAWGIRFTNVIVLADNGGVELRYQALDDTTSAKIHEGNATSNELPSITVDGTNSSVAPSAVLMHFHHGDITTGRTYSIIYGNAGGVVTVGEFVTIVMKDGLKIEHIEVSN